MNVKTMDIESRAIKIKSSRRAHSQWKVGDFGKMGCVQQLAAHDEPT